MGADAERDLVGLPVDHADLAVVNAERFGANLRDHGFEALSDRGAAGDDLHDARRIDGDFRPVGRAKPTLLHEHRKPDADKLATGAPPFALRAESLPVGNVEHPVEQGQVIAGVVLDFFAKRHERPDLRQFGRGKGVAPPDLDRINPEPVGDRIDHPFADERRLEPSGRAIGGGGRLVGEPDVADRAIGRHAVRSRNKSADHHGDADGVGAQIGALVVPELVVDREDVSVAIHRGPDPVGLFARMVGADQVLAAVLDPFHRAAKPHRGDADQYILRIKLAANAETAADMGLVQMDRRRSAIQHAREQIAGSVRDFRRPVQFEDVAGRIVAADGAARLQRHAGVAPDGERQFNNLMRVAKRRVDVAVALVNDRRFGVASRREFARRGLGVEDHGQFPDVHGHQIGSVLRDIRIVGEHHCDWIADVAHAVGREHRLAIGFKLFEAAFAETDRRDVRNVGGAPHGDDTRKRLGGAGIDGDNLAVRDIRTDDAHVKLMGK